MRKIHLVATCGAACALALAGCEPVVATTDQSAELSAPSAGVESVAVFAVGEWLPFETALPESSHPYRNRQSQRWTIGAPDCVQALRVRFDRIAVERGYDVVRLRDASGALVQSWTGQHSGVLSEAVTGHALTIELITDRTVTDWGFAVSGVEVVEGQLHCPMYVTPRCPDGSMPMAQPRELCGCQPPPHCTSLADLVVDLTTGGGFSGLTTGHRVDGSGQLWTLRHFPGQAIETAPYGQANWQVVQQLASALAGAGLLGQNVVGGESANMTSSLTTTFAGVTSSIYWPAFDNPPERVLDALTAWKQLLSCDDGSDLAATCAAGLNCVDTVCTTDAAPPSEPDGSCATPADCAGLPHLMCVGDWSCVDGRCDYQCGPPPADPWRRESVDFGTANPYANDQELGWRVSGDADSARLRLSFSAFDLETDYDFVILYDANWNELYRYTGARGAFVSDVVEGNQLYLVFSSDSSVVSSGFRVDAIELQ